MLLTKVDMHRTNICPGPRPIGDRVRTEGLAPKDMMRL